MSFLQANEKLDDNRTPTTMPTPIVVKHDEFKDYNGVRRAPQEEKKEEVCMSSTMGKKRTHTHTHTHTSDFQCLRI